MHFCHARPGCAAFGDIHVSALDANVGLSWMQTWVGISLEKLLMMASSRRAPLLMGRLTDPDHLFAAAFPAACAC